MQRKTNTKSRFDEKFDFEAFCAFSHSLYQFVDFTQFSAHRNPHKLLQNNELHPFFGKQTDYILAQKTRFSARNHPILAMKNEIFVSIWCYFTPFSVQITLFPLLNYISLLFVLTFLLCLNLVYSTFEERTDQQSHTKRSGVAKNQFGDSGRCSAFYALFQLRSQNAQTAKQQPKGSSFALHNSFKTAPALLTKVPHHNSLPYSPCTRTHPQQENYKKTQSSFSSAFPSSLLLLNSLSFVSDLQLKRLISTPISSQQKKASPHCQCSEEKPLQLEKEELKDGALQRRVFLQAQIAVV